MMKRFCLAYFATALIFLGLDAVWLSQTQALLYRPALEPLLATAPSPEPAVLFYLVYLLGVVFFCVAPALRADAWRTALLHGLLFGLCAYATYDLTNQATLRIWPVRVTVIDLAWGSAATAAAATVGFLVTRLLLKATGGAGPQPRST